MAQKVHESMRELFEGWDPSKDNLQDFYETFRTAAEEQMGAMLPGDGNPEDHFIEQLIPSHGEIARQMAEAREGHRIAEEFPERGAYHGGPPVPDMGGQTVPYSGDDRLYRQDDAPDGPRSRTSQGRDVSKAPLTRGFPVIQAD